MKRSKCQLGLKCNFEGETASELYLSENLFYNSKLAAFQYFDKYHFSSAEICHRR